MKIHLRESLINDHDLWRVGIILRRESCPASNGIPSFAKSFRARCVNVDVALTNISAVRTDYAAKKTKLLVAP